MSPGVATAMMAGALLLAGRGGSVMGLATPQSASEELAQLIEEVGEVRRADHTLPLPDGADERYADRLDSVGVERFEHEKEGLAELLTRLGTIDRSQLDGSQRIDAELLRIQVSNRVTELQHRGYLLPLGSRSGFHFAFANRPASGRFEEADDYDEYIGAMQSFLEHSRQQIALMRAGIEAGMVMPRAVLEGYEHTAGQHVVEQIEASSFFKPLAAIPEQLAPETRSRILADASAALRDSVIPAYRELRDFFVQEYIPAARPSLGLTALPKGGSYYRHRVAMYTTLDMTAEEVHQLGLDEVARLRADMEAIMQEVGFEGDYLDFIEFLRTDPRFYVQTQQGYLEAVAYVAKLMEGHLPELFERLPRTPYGVRKIPDHVAPRQSAGYYDRGNPDGTRAGWININTSQLYSRPLWVTRALAFHEGVPGHHLQIMLAQESDEISEFRRRGGITAFTEGWGLYAERLGLDVGLYDDPYDRFGMYSYQIWRACRLVVDTGMHALGWRREAAIAFMAENTGMGIDPVTAEIDRHITEPGQGLAYKIGELKITELRHRAERELGDHFDLRAFHDVVLRNGAIPLSILETQVDGWIQETQGQE